MEEDNKPFYRVYLLVAKTNTPHYLDVLLAASTRTKVYFIQHCLYNCLHPNFTYHAGLNLGWTVSSKLNFFSAIHAPIDIDFS